jgi:A/G-specific adenine glycosylase
MGKVQSRDKKTGDIAPALLAHYQGAARILPWRVPPPERTSERTKLPDAYHVWLSEIMLQQTTVAAVIPYFHAFTQRWPSFAALAAADDADIMAAWAGLGYYARARNLLACARAVVAEHDGALPRDEATLLRLPGIGAYTAAAITAIAYGQRAVVVDANIERVVARLFGIDTPLPAAKPAIREAMDAITPKARSGDFAQAMMDLGASLCRVRAPSCLACPLSFACRAFAQGKAEAYPVKAAKKIKPVRRGTAYWIKRDDTVWIVQRSDKGLLAGMRALPDDHWTARVDGDATPPFAANWYYLDETVQHSFTHFTLFLKIAVTAGPLDLRDLPVGAYWPVISLDKAGLPTLFLKASKAVMAHKKHLGE